MPVGFLSFKRLIGSACKAASECGSSLTPALTSASAPPSPPTPATMAKKSFVCVLLLGLAFMLVFTGFQTQGNMQQMVIDSIHKEDPSFNGSGYISLAVIYAVFATTNWVAPSALSLMGAKATMLCGAVTYVAFVASFLWPQTWLLYLMSVLVGAGAALIWTAQGNYLTLVSDEATITRNSGVFWAMLQCSMVFGNIFVFYKFQGQETVDAQTRMVVFIALTAVCVVGTVLMVFLPRPPPPPGPPTPSSPSQELIKSARLFKTPQMLLLCVTFLYTGFELSFFSGVYSSSLSFTLRFADPKMLVGLSGISIGCGEIVGGLIFGIFGTKTVKFGRDPIVLLGFFTHIICFFLIFLNVPNAAPLGETYDSNFLSTGDPSVAVALLCSFMLGFGDACYNTQIYSILGSVYSDNSGPAFALFKFTQSLSAALCFFYSSVLSLHFHLLILVLFCCAGTLTFCVVEWSNAIKNRPVDSAKDDPEDKYS